MSISSDEIDWETSFEKCEPHEIQPVELPVPRDKYSAPILSDLELFTKYGFPQGYHDKNNDLQTEICRNCGKWTGDNCRYKGNYYILTGKWINMVPCEGSVWNFKRIEFDKKCSEIPVCHKCIGRFSRVNRRYLILKKMFYLKRIDDKCHAN